MGPVLKGLAFLDRAGYIRRTMIGPKTKNVLNGATHQALAAARRRAESEERRLNRADVQDVVDYVLACLCVQHEEHERPDKRKPTRTHIEQRFASLKRLR